MGHIWIRFNNEVGKKFWLSVAFRNIMGYVL